MSVINTMLTDLERRQLTPDALTVDVSARTGSPRRDSQRSRSWVLGIISIAVFVGVYIVGSLWFEPATAKQVAVDVTASKRDVRQSPMAEAGNIIVSDKAVEIESSAPRTALIEDEKITPNEVLADIIEDAFHAVPDASKVTTAAAIATNDDVDRLLAQAELALLRERLTQPVADNAYDRYQQVLAIDSNNLNAVAGIEKIRQRYLQLIVKYMKAGNKLKVERYSVIARQVGVPEPTLEQWLANYQADKTLQVNKKPLQVNKKSQQGTLSKPPLVKPSESFQASWQTREQHLLRQLTADTAVLPPQKITLLQHFIQQNPEATHSRQQLLTLFIAQQQWDQAQTMIDQAANVDRIEKDLWQAQVWHAQGQWSPLIERLSQAKYTAASYPQQVALRAAALHQLRNYERSVKDYAELVKSYPQQATYWLGLALGLDALANGHALAAFQQTKTLTRDNANYLDYVNQRITALSR